jgi:protein O-GlcNAc transferase
MGIAANSREIAVGARGQVWFMADSSNIAPRIEPAGRYDRCYLARSAIVTGQIQCHELAWGEGSDGEPLLWLVNTRFSCLANLDPGYSFVPRWRPPFVTALAGEDRCHMNGMALRDGRPAFVTTMSQTDTPTGWRADKNNTGCVLAVPSGEVVTTGLAMPHSPRWHRERLLVLNSGWGTLEAVDVGSGERTRIASLPGFTRGLACYANLAFVGLSRIRETAVFGGVPIAERHAELKCGIGVIDLRNGKTIATLEFESGVEEIFDVQVLPDAQCVALSGDRPDGPENHEIWVVPQGSENLAAQGRPDNPAVEELLARAEAASSGGRGAEAVASLRQASAARPRSAEIANTLGNALQVADDPAGALEAYRHAVSEDPRFVPALQNLGYLLVAQGYTDDGIEQVRRAHEISPQDVNRVMMATALPIVYESRADLDARRARIERDVQTLVDEGVVIDTTTQRMPTNFFAAYTGHEDRPLQQRLGRIYRGIDARPAPRGKRTDGRIRIGFISAYFSNHTIGGLNLGRVQHLSRDRFEVVVLSSSTSRDQLAASYAQAADRLVRLPREIAAARTTISEQDLDILFFADVGMDSMTTTLAFSRMAPVQCATWGHPVTTGSPAIDYFISSELLEVEDADAHYTEQLIRLPSLGTYYHRPVVAEGVDREALGLSAGAHLYACPQTLFKFHPDYDPLLAEILRRDPEGELVLIEGRTHWTSLLRERFERTMPDVTGRIRWLRPMARPAFLRLLSVCDVVLDPTAFGGGNTTYEALAVGAPVVTLPGAMMRTRITRALYTKAAYDELVVGSESEYVEKVLALGTDADYRASVVGEIKQRCEVLYEDASEVRDLEDALAALGATSA